MSNFPTIAADTPFNDAAILDQIVDALDERWRAAGGPGAGPRSVWFSVPETAGYTASGTFGVEQEDSGQIAGDGTDGPYNWRVAVHPPVKPGTVHIDAEDGEGNIVQSLTDDGAGNLSDEADGAGEFDYNTGCAAFTFTDPVPSYAPIVARYQSAWTELAVSGAGTPAYPWWPTAIAGHRVHVAGKGDFTCLWSSGGTMTVEGDASCSGAALSLAPAGNVINAAFWATLQACIQAVVPCYLNSYAYTGGFEGESAFSYFSLTGDWLTAAGLEHFPRRVRARGPCSLTYDSETDTTTVYDYGSAEPDFAAGHVGKRIDIFGIGLFIVASVVDAQTITVSGRAEHPDTVVSILPDDPMDQDDAAFDKFGPCEVGDVMGPWLLYDLIAAMKPLAWTAPTAGWANAGEPNARHGIGVDADLATAESDAEAAFNAGDPLTWDAGLYAVTQTDDRYYYLFGTWRAEVTRQRAKAGWIVPADSAPLVYDVDVYGLPSPPAGAGQSNNVFDGNGDFPASGELHLLGSESGLTDRSGVTTAWFGSLTAPAWPAASPPPWQYRGYGAVAYAVVKWHFAYTP